MEPAEPKVVRSSPSVSSPAGPIVTGEHPREWLCRCVKLNGGCEHGKVQRKQ